jgi:hypothetical protein
VQQRERNRIADMFYLVFAALLVCVVGVGAFLLADIWHANPLWVFFSLASLGILAGAREDYRKQFQSPRFVAFVCGWAVLNVVVFISVLGLFGWLWLVPALLLEQFLFYMTAYWFFGVQPPAKRWPFQRVESSEKHDI